MRERVAGIDPLGDDFVGLQSPTIGAPHVIGLPTVADARGDLTFIEGGRDVPFDVKRVYYFYGMGPGERRGSLAHTRTDLCLVALAGRVRLRLDDGAASLLTTLDRPDRALLIPRMTWIEMDDFAPGTVCLVLSSEHYDEADYIRDYGAFIRLARSS